MPDISTINGVAEDNIASWNGTTASEITSVNANTWVHTIVYDLFAWGDGVTGQLGIGNTTDRSSPTALGAGTEWLGEHSGTIDHSIAIKSNGTLWGWGVNSYAKLGDGTTTTRSSPVQLGSATNWVVCASSSYSGHAINSDGELWGWGFQGAARLGNGETGHSNITAPVQIGSGSSWYHVSISDSGGSATTTDNKLYTWGDAVDGRRGDGNSTSGNYVSVPTQIGSLTNWLRCNTGEQGASLAIKTDSTLWAWGVNSEGMLGTNVDGNTSSPVQVGSLTNWVHARCGIGHSLGVTADGKLWSWGSNGNGCSGRGNPASVYATSVPTQVGSLTTWYNVIAGDRTSFATKTDGTLWAWGFNNVGQLGDGSTTDRHSPVQIGSATDWHLSELSTGTMDETSHAFRSA
tara:strand:- start:676 stop:1887 length:1212 start_codon:yes stop_codon:yes gene_type:complete